MMSSTSRFVVVLAVVLKGALLLCAAGCSPSEEDIQAEWDETVAASNACQSAADCALVSPGCPLGCFAAVNSAKKAEVEARAAELIKEYESGGMACAYSCLAPGPLECTGGQCTVGSSM
jgi:hypothetical protein